jgi:hypothetical protein
MDTALSSFITTLGNGQSSKVMPNDPTPRDQAIYVPSLSPGFCKDVYSQNWPRPLPQGVQPDDLNILNPNSKLLHLAYVMTSAGQALNQHQPCIVTERDRRTSVVIADNSGYQTATLGKAITTDEHRMKILRWQEKVADIGLVLDVPTGPLMDPKKSYIYKTQQECLKAALAHMDFWKNNHVLGQIRWLAILQGNDTRFSNIWYEQTMKHAGFCNGVAFAGILRHNFEHVIGRILQMVDENRLQHMSHIHVLGTNELDAAVMLTAIQRAINKHINPDLRISYDTGAPSKLLAYNGIYSMPRFDGKSMTMQSMDAPDGPEFIGSLRRWPWPSPIGDKMLMKDFVVRPNLPNARWRDTQSNNLMIHHNIGALCAGIVQANRVFDIQNVNHEHQIGRHVGAAIQAVEDIFASGGSEVVFNKLKGVFTLLRHGKAPDAGDDLRDLEAGDL